MSDSDKYETDKWIRAMFPKKHWFDPCPINWDPATDKDGLETDWHYYVRLADNQYQGAFVNPPYSDPLPWVKKAIIQSKNMTVIMLLKHDSSTEWFRLLHEAGARFVMTNKRLKHRTGRSASFPSVLAVLTHE